MALTATRKGRTTRPAARLKAVPDQHAQPGAQQPRSLAERLAEAQQAAQEPARRVAELEAALENALSRKDYAAAQAAEAELPEARQEHALAAAMVTALQGAIAEIEDQRQREMSAIEDQRRKEEARAEIERQRQVFREAQEESSRLRATIDAGLAAVRGTIAEALAADAEAAEAVRRMNNARQVLGEGPMGPPPPMTKGLIERDRLIGDIWNRSPGDPVDGKLWPR